MENKQSWISNNDGYGTHLGLLDWIFSIYNIDSVLEFGLGFYSTPYFLKKSETVVSIEMQSEDWFVKVKNEIKDEKWLPILNLQPATIFDSVPNQKFDLVFVDGHADNRPECVNYFFGKCDIIVAHDTECNVYGWDRVRKPENYSTFEFNYKGSKTTAFVKNDLIN